MLDLSEVSLPDTIIVSGIEFKIKTDFRYWLKISKALKNNEDLSFIFLDINDIPSPDLIDDTINELLNFYSPKEELPRSVGKQSNEIVFDYETDADYIYSAFLELYRIDLMDPSLRLHWWIFSALLKGIHGTKLDEIIGFRSYNPNDKSTFEQNQKQLKSMWRIIPERREEILPASLQNFNKLLSKKK